MHPDDGDGQAPVSVGDVLLGRYRIEEALAEGGHSLVFRVEDERLRRPACAKLFRVEGADASTREIVKKRFVQEALLLGRFTHPGTLQIYDFGYLETSGGEIPFQICELVAGGPLSRLVRRRGRLDPATTAALVTSLCDTLAEVHAAGYVHLDVKPQNILLQRTRHLRTPKLADFGIAQLARTPLPVDVSSVLLYSVNWAAPEQMVGDPVGPECDLYSLSLVTIYALTGQLVFRDTDPAQAYRLRQYAGDVIGGILEGQGFPDELVALLVATCAFDPGARASDALEFAERLSAALGRYETTAVTPLSSEESPVVLPSEAAAGEPSLPGRVGAASVWPLSVHRKPPVVADRLLRFVAHGSAVDLLPGDNVRLRVSVVPTSKDRPGLHVQGLNCFVSHAGRRPSGGLTLDGDGPFECYSPRGERIGSADVSFAAAGPAKTVVTVAGQSLIVATDECAHLVALDFGAGRECVLLYDTPA